MPRAPRYSVTQRRELMYRVARNPEFSCCCIRLSREDRFRAKRVFRISRGAVRSWEQERRDREKAQPSALPTP